MPGVGDKRNAYRILARNLKRGKSTWNTSAFLKALEWNLSKSTVGRKWISEKEDGRPWTGLVWLRIQPGDVLLPILQQASSFCNIFMTFVTN
jgi:hypothetical protein